MNDVMLLAAFLFACGIVVCVTFIVYAIYDLLRNSL